MMRGLMLQRRSQNLGKASAGLVHRLVGEVVLVDAEVSRMLMVSSNALLDRSAASSTHHHHACTSYSSTRSNDGSVRELSTTINVQKQQEKVMEDREEYEDDFCSDGSERELSTTINVQKQQEKVMEDREEYEDTRPGSRAQFENMKQAPQPTKQQWWRPDPETGIWVPEEYEGQVTTSTLATKSPSRLTRIRTDATTSLEDKKWWTSMEELPDMDRADK